MNEDNVNGRIGAVMRFFLFCAAADLGFLEECPKSEHHKYAGEIGRAHV